jgi:hypothetical protein
MHNQDDVTQLSLFLFIANCSAGLEADTLIFGSIRTSLKARL